MARTEEEKKARKKEVSKLWREKNKDKIKAHRSTAEYKEGRKTSKGRTVATQTAEQKAKKIEYDANRRADKSIADRFRAKFNDIEWEEYKKDKLVRQAAAYAKFKSEGGGIWEDFKIKRSVRMKEYNKKPEVQQRIKEYLTQPEVQQRIKKTREAYNQLPEVKQRREEYYYAPEVQARLKEYRQRPEVKQKKKDYYQSSPEIKQRASAYQRAYQSRPEAKQKKKDYQSRPEIKQKKNEYNKTPQARQRIEAYYNRPEVIQRIQKYRDSPEVKHRLKEYSQRPENKERSHLSGVISRLSSGRLERKDVPQELIDLQLMNLKLKSEINEQRK